MKVTSKTIDVKMNDINGPSIGTVEGRILSGTHGLLAIHEYKNVNHTCHVTHLPTGFCFAHGRTHREAIELAEWRWAECKTRGVDLTSTDPYDIGYKDAIDSQKRRARAG